MCFRINKEAKRPKKKIVWKVVCLFDNLVCSEITKYTWHTGEHKINKSARKEYYGNARAGFYVFLTKSAAQEYAFSHEMLLKLHVSPSDWLFTSDGGDVATYRKVTVPETQPEIKWY
jgi:hypothetical protein